MSIEIDITKNGTTTLATAGKYCNRNIDVNVNVAGGGEVSFTQCFDGTLSGAYEDDNIESLRYGAFAGCTNITSVKLSNCTKILGNYAFYGMGNVKEISLPNLKEGSLAGTFMECPELTKIDLRGLNNVSIGAQCFRNCTKLSTIILGGTFENGNPVINTLANTNALLGTPTTMKIYVPDDLVDTYKGETNWDNYGGRFFSYTDGGITND